MEIEERGKIGLTALEKTSEIKREGVRENEKDEDEHVRKRSCEITSELAPHNNAHVMHESSFASGGYRAEYFVEPAGLQMQLFEFESLAGSKLTYGRKNLRPGTRQSGQARIALTDFN